MQNSNRSQVKRSPKRGIYDREDIYQILDTHSLCHVALIHNKAPVVIPTMYGRSGDSIFIHGASVSRLITELEGGVDVCVSVAQINDLVLARSAFHHSMNYESVVIFGKAKLVGDNEKELALKRISDHLIPGRWEEVRKPNSKELKATKVIEIEMIDVSAKARTGGPVDDKEDYALPIWAGNVPVLHRYGMAKTDDKLEHDLGIPESVQRLVKKK